jgi:thiamine pyrophosphate-dependent acetolactate synthase large subunit-like protein
VASSRKLRVGEAIIDLLVREYELDTVFGIPGVHNIELFRGLHSSGVRVVAPRHEQGAGFMADGWSIATGKPGVCALISGPGLTNAITPIAQAYHDSRAMLVLASTTPTHSLGKKFGPLHDLDDQSAVVRTVTAFSETVTDPTQLPQLIERAWNVFTSSRPRPVHIAIPTDVLEQFVDPFTRVTTDISKPVAQDSDIQRAVQLLAEAKRPIIIAGGGALGTGELISNIATAIDSPIVLTGNAKGEVPSTHPLCVGSAMVIPRVQEEIEQSDVVLVIGSEISDADLYNGGRAQGFSGNVIRIDIDAEQISRRVMPHVSLVADAADSLSRISAELTKAGIALTNSGSARATNLRMAARSGVRQDLLPWIDAIEQSIPDNTLVAVDSTQLAYAAHTVMSCNSPRSWLAPFGFGTLGCALPMAIGAAIADTTRPVLAIAGDGGWLFTVAEMAAAIDEGIDMVLVLWDNRGYGQIRESFDDVRAPRMGVDVSSHDPSAIAKGFGWNAIDVTTIEAFRIVLSEAFENRGAHFIRISVS